MKYILIALFLWATNAKAQVNHDDETRKYKTVTITLETGWGRATISGDTAILPDMGTIHFIKIGDDVFQINRQTTIEHVVDFWDKKIYFDTSTIISRNKLLFDSATITPHHYVVPATIK